MWYQHFASHQQVQAIFASRLPSLESARVSELLFSPGHMLRFSADLPLPAEVDIERWRTKGFTHVQFRFQVSLIGAPRLVGLPLGSTACRIDLQEQVFAIAAHDQSWSLSGDAFLESVQAQPFTEPGAGHGFNWFVVNRGG